MKRNTYKIVSFLFVAFFISGLHAQKFDKKITENFKVNKDVIVAINASNADIDVTTWNRNEVAVDAVITVEGLTKKEAEKYLNNWKFEALGNKSKVQINANANQFLHFPDNDFTFNIGDVNFSDIEFPEINFEDFNIEIPEINFENLNIEIPEINIDFDEILDEIDNNDFKDGDDERTFSFMSSGKRKTITITSQKEWNTFKNSKEYQEMKKDIRESLKNAKHKIKNIDSKKIQSELRKAKIEYEKIDKDKIREEIKKARLAYKNIDKQKIKASLEKAKASIEKMKLQYGNSYKNGNNIIIIEDGKNKKEVKITRKIKVKVPKNATFDLNTRHSKVKLPKGKTSGKVSYGTFNSEGLNGGKLNISYSPVTIADLNACTLFLNNVTDAKIASVTNSKVDTNSSGLIIENINKNVSLKNEFGELTVGSFQPNFGGFNLTLKNSEAILNLGNTKTNFKYQVNKIKLDNKRVNTITKNAPKDNIISVFGGYSSLVIK